jgi:hypothetical protein
VVGGLYSLQVAGTPVPGYCLRLPSDMVAAQQTVWNSLKALWDNPFGPVRDNLNVVSADFVNPSVFWGDIVNMNVEPEPPDPR